MRRFLLTASLVLLTASRISAATLLVDDDLVECPSAPYTTIQAAVAAAAAGDTVKLCAGLYSGQVVVPVQLKITGKAPNVSTCGSLPPLNPANYSIYDAPAVAGPGGIGIDVLATKVKIEKIVVRNAGEAGIRTGPTIGKFSMKAAVLTQNANAIDFNSALNSHSLITANCFDQNGSGIRVNDGLLDAKIDKNVFVGNTVAGILMDQPSAVVSEDVKIYNSDSISDAIFAVIVGTNQVRFEKNKILGGPTTSTGFLIGANNTDLKLKKNSVLSAAGTGIRTNAVLYPGFPPSAPSTGASIIQNKIVNPGSHGITVESVAGETSLTASLITKNTVQNGGSGGSGDGIRIEDPLGTGANGGNEVESNTITGSANHDCHDASIGGGTAGTANLWQVNTATTQSVANLCFTGAANGVAD